MLTNSDIKKLRDVFATKEDFADLSLEIGVMREDLKLVKETVETINKRDLEDSNLLMKLYLDHDNQIKKLQKALR